MPMPKGKFIDVDGVKTHFYEKGKGRPIVLVHGGNFGSKESSGNSWTWSLNLDALAKRYHVIAVDKLGQGFTGKGRRFTDFKSMSAFDRITSASPPTPDIPGVASDFRF